MLLVVCGLMFVCVLVVAMFPFRVLWCSCVLSLLYVACCVCYVWFVVVRSAVLFVVVYRNVSCVACVVMLALSMCVVDC